MANRTEHRTYEGMPHDAETQTQNYIDRLKEIIERENSQFRERLMQKFLIRYTRNK